MYRIIDFYQIVLNEKLTIAKSLSKITTAHELDSQAKCGNYKPLVGFQELPIIQAITFMLDVISF